jgi:hypothetical protein
VRAPPKSIAKRILFVLFEGLPATVIDTQVPLHVRAAQAALAARFEVSGWPKAHSLAGCSGLIITERPNRLHRNAQDNREIPEPRSA